MRLLVQQQPQRRPQHHHGGRDGHDPSKVVSPHRGVDRTRFGDSSWRIPTSHSRRGFRRRRISNVSNAVAVSLLLLLFCICLCRGFAPPTTLTTTAPPPAVLRPLNRYFTSSLTLRSSPKDCGGFVQRRRSQRTTNCAMKATDKNEGPSDDANSGESSATASANSSSSSSSWLLSLCLPLWLVYVSNQWSRFSINSLVDFSSASEAFSAMNVDLNFNQAQYGLLASVAFTSLFALASVAAGYLTDKVGDRKRITVLSALAWSAATLGMSQSSSYAQVVACRVATGLACAFSTPAAYTLLKERVPSTQQALASSVYGTGVAVASALTALSIVLDNQYGWRNTLALIAAAGFAATLASTFLLPSDDEKVVSTESNDDDTKSNTNNVPFVEEVRDVLLSNRRVQWIYLASLLRFGSGLTIGIWGAPYFRLAYPDSQNLFAAYLATISAVGATVSGIAGGAVADWLSQRTDNNGEVNSDDLSGRRLWVPIVGSILAAPAWFLAVQPHQDFQTSMGFLALEYLVAECWFGPIISTLQASVKPGTGGTAQGIFTLTGAVGNLAPSVVGFLYAASTAGDNAAGADNLSGLLAAGVGFGYLSSAACFAMASRASPQPVVEKAKQS